MQSCRHQRVVRVVKGCEKILNVANIVFRRLFLTLFRHKDPISIFSFMEKSNSISKKFVSKLSFKHTTVFSLCSLCTVSRLLHSDCVTNGLQL